MLKMPIMNHANRLEGHSCLGERAFEVYLHALVFSSSGQPDQLLLSIHFLFIILLLQFFVKSSVFGPSDSHLSSIAFCEDGPLGGFRSIKAFLLF